MPARDAVAALSRASARAVAAGVGTGSAAPGSVAGAAAATLLVGAGGGAGAAVVVDGCPDARDPRSQPDSVQSAASRAGSSNSGGRIDTSSWGSRRPYTPAPGRTVPNARFGLPAIGQAERQP
jgi:hypothetical protein